jgi:hypothetical protein
MTEIPEEALTAATRAFHNLDEAGWIAIGETARSFALKTMTRALTAALPHLRVQETPACICPPAQVWGSGGDLIDQDSDPECPVHAPHPRPVVDREAIVTAIVTKFHVLHPRIPDLGKGDCHCELLAQVAADAVLALLPTEEEIKAEIVHLIADGEAVTLCCGRTPFELPRTDRVTVDPSLARGCGGESL